MEIGYILLGLVLGFTVGWLFSTLKNKNNSLVSGETAVLKTQIDKLNGDIRVKEERINILSSDISEIKSEYNLEKEKVLKLSSEIASKTSDFENLKEKLLEQKQELENIQTKFSVEFKNLANEILEEKTKKFTEQNKVNLDQLLKPLGEKIKDFEKKVDEAYDKEAQQRFSLKEEVKRLAELNQQISKEANNLTNALKGENKTQGNWGEIILENILEKSGLIRDREYFIQASYTNDEGKRYQPDVVIHYPGEKCIIIDSKVSLNAYERYSSSGNAAEQETALKDHLLSIKNHISGLSAKSYQDIYEIKTLDFVMMFMPIEPAYMIAIQHEPDLWNYAYERRVLLISPTNLIASLKMIVSLWRQEYQNQNALEIARQGGALYDKLVGFVEDLQSVKKKLSDAQSGLDNSLNKLSEGKGNVLRSAEKIRELGAKTKKILPLEPEIDS
ncbi:MAG: DNA polymerase V [Bacteroidetes bacterium GWF2_33_38]|nr:MAG: DNA polymerase V [Bacteroidetes bacterium GWF2_33_38]OFY76320.1 MAG: DNA polymerase V [Bacteroidetes bacterium RIFOXYA12_FULL_33_9]OFY92185.1 MAG: DNA polymerase V [Bacteroidetes bacterium RIFOXYA2_FULL_33_7]HBX50574.1 DNA recombination protein RmuC [Bacteroidales bacterium]